MLTKLKSQKGFSLVELMVVIAIIGALTAVALPMYNKYRAKSQQQIGLRSLMAWTDAFKTAYSANESTFKIEGDSTVYSVASATEYVSPTFQASNFTTSCTYSTFSRITAGEITFHDTTANAGTGTNPATITVTGGALCYDLVSAAGTVAGLQNLAFRIKN